MSEREKRERELFVYYEENINSYIPDHLDDLFDDYGFGTVDETNQENDDEEDLAIDDDYDSSGWEDDDYYDDDDYWE